MLSIYFGDMPQAIYNTPTYFNNVYLDSWLEDALDQRMIKAVDKGVVCGPNAVETKALGLIPPTKLSGGVKTDAHPQSAGQGFQCLQLRQ